mmetsp:Transcript_134884/g.288595  ORF Transcript_134884/g.288595 Transcript_134884/m.288595 type:complete len:156 (+) Transcript_134884:1-468(+)
MDIWNPSMAKQMKDGVDGEWKYGLHDQKLNCLFHDGSWNHMFHCDMYIWTTMRGHRFHDKYQKAKHAGTLDTEFDQKTLDEWLARNQLYETGASQGYLWDYTFKQFEDGWKSLATGSSRCYRVDVDHSMMKFDEDIAKEIAQLLRNYCDVQGMSP